MTLLASIQRHLPNCRTIFVSFVLALQLAGCSIPRAERKNMLPTDVPTSPRNESTVALQVTSEELPLDMLPVAEFRAALEMAIRTSGVFGRVEAAGPTKYLIRVRINSMDTPTAFAGDMQVRLVIHWELQRTDTGATLWKDIIATKHVSPSSDAVAALARAKIALEASARSNIREAFAQIRELNLN